MYINTDKRVIFVHNPKTGGLSVRALLGFSSEPNFRFIHMTIDEAIEYIFQCSWSSFYSFAFVRNPWDRIVSLYEYQRTHTYGIFINFDQTHIMARNYTFSEWMDINIKMKKSRYFGIPQSKWVDGVTDIYRFEDFTESCKHLCEIIGVEHQAFHENKTLRKHYKEYFSKQLHIDFVAELDSFVVNRFGYDF